MKTLRTQNWNTVLAEIIPNLPLNLLGTLTQRKNKHSVPAKKNNGMEFLKRTLI